MQTDGHCIKMKKKKRRADVNKFSVTKYPRGHRLRLPLLLHLLISYHIAACFLFPICRPELKNFLFFIVLYLFPHWLDLSPSTPPMLSPHLLHPLPLASCLLFIPSPHWHLFVPHALNVTSRRYSGLLPKLAHSTETTRIVGITSFIKGLAGSQMGQEKKHYTLQCPTPEQVMVL